MLFFRAQILRNGSKILRPVSQKLRKRFANGNPTADKEVDLKTEVNNLIFSMHFVVRKPCKVFLLENNNMLPKYQLTCSVLSRVFDLLGLVKYL